MSATTRITVTLPEEQVTELRKLTGNVSAYIAAAVDRRIRHDLLAQDLARYEQEHGEFTADEIAAAQAELDSDGAGSNAA
ncbi:hypothetical protein [Nocardia macrotermitis]|uniref:hypothetical protein n=1 Tax=Nocardia macrotermitis TaxID=2585198 RepID=UPI00129806E1|nr:hypothetical protein [Nocardia macrotermitis]